MSKQAAVVFNPLFRFRAPKWYAKRFRSKHLLVRPEEVENDTGVLNIYPGDFRYLPDPTLEIDLAIWEEDGSPKSFASYVKMTTKDGFQPALKDEWEVAERLKTVWSGETDAAGRLCVGGGRAMNSKLVLMWRTAESAERSEKRLLRTSDEIQKSVEERQSELQDKLAPLGARVRVRLEDEDEDDDESINTSAKPPWRGARR